MPEDYKKYLKLQVGRAENKWARNPNDDAQFRTKLLSDWNEIKDLVGDIENLICMGCRDGTELFEFRDFCRGAKILGIDLTENVGSIRVSKVHGVSVRVQDFSDLPKSWQGNFDLVYSNSLDHAYDPYSTLKEWHRVCKGHLLVQLATKNKPNMIEHCFEKKDIPRLFPEDLFEIVETWESETLNVLAKVIK